MGAVMAFNGEVSMTCYFLMADIREKSVGNFERSHQLFFLTRTTRQGLLLISIDGVTTTHSQNVAILPDVRQHASGRQGRRGRESMGMQYMSVSIPYSEADDDTPEVDQEASRRHHGRRGRMEERRLNRR
jgi:hypothetical protein